MAKTHVQLNVEGMSCNHCVSAVETALKGLTGVQAVTVDLQAKQVDVDFDNASVTVDQMKAEIEEAGYDVV